MTLSPQDRWFVDNGLPYFADPVRAQVRRRLGPWRLVPAMVLIGAVSAFFGWWFAGALPYEDAGLAVYFALQSFLIFAGIYALFAFRAGTIVRWAMRRTLRSLGMLYPLVTRALPMLLLFITFLFINAEVWQVAAHLKRSEMGYVVMIFAAMAAFFLIARLPEMVGEFDDGLNTERIELACAGTPMAEHTALDEDDGIDEPIVGLERANLVLVLLVSQAIQVLLLAFAVFAFFLLFGALTIEPSIIKTWSQQPADLLIGDFMSLELIQVAVFLSAFSGLYFTVTAVSDDEYRREFFSAVTDEMERAVAVREVYRAMRRSTT